MESTLVWKEEFCLLVLCFFVLLCSFASVLFRLSTGKEIWQSIIDYLSVPSTHETIFFHMLFHLILEEGGEGGNGGESRASEGGEGGGGRERN